jgi:hypothetical protein
MKPGNEQREIERENRSMLDVKRVLQIIAWLAAVALFALAGRAVFASTVRDTQNMTTRGTAQVSRQSHPEFASPAVRSNQREGVRR